jgi:xylan 1,4-beta-xylosidase
MNSITQHRHLDAILVLLLLMADGLNAQVPAQASTYCNPIAIPNYPIGKFARDLSKGDTGPEWMWRLGYKQQFRELADVTALWFEGKFYLYPSVDMAWVSDDLGATWKHHPLNVRDLGYAPTVVRHVDRFLLIASNSPIYSSKSPLGPFEVIGKIGLERKEALPDFVDPMLFSDADQRLYFYWGCTPKGGIWGVELDGKDPTKVIGTPKELIPFDPIKFPWEAVGQWNQNPRTGWMEGAWMLKRGNKYYLTYSAGGTENRTYAMGAYVSDSPLGPFEPQKRNPILRTIDGLVTGSAHGSIIAGPNDELWAFYSVRASVVHAFERRLGMDRAEIDSNGERPRRQNGCQVLNRSKRTRWTQDGCQ